MRRDNLSGRRFAARGGGIGEIPIAAGVEVLAHELAHVAAPEDQTHGEAWQAAFDRIFDEYNRIAQELFGEVFTNDG